MTMEHHQPLDSTVRSQDSNNSSDSKDTKVSKISDSTGSSKNSKPESCLESKHSKEVLIDINRHSAHQVSSQHQQQQRAIREPRDDSNTLMFTSCGQLLLGIVQVVFGVLVLVHGASLGGSGAGLWAGASALAAGALGVVATLASSSLGEPTGSFSSAHLASSLVSLALSNMAAITALTAVVRDSQRAPTDTLLTIPDRVGVEMEEGWAGLLASIGLFIACLAELLVSGYTCVILTPKLCSCLRPSNDDVEETTYDGKTLKTRNMVHQWVIAQNHVPKNQPFYVVQPVVPVHPIMQPPYGMHPAPPPPGKFTGGFLTTPIPPAAATAAAYGILQPAHMAYPARPQIVRGKQQHQQPKKRRHSSDHIENGGGHRRSSTNSHQQHSSSSSDEKQSRKPTMASIGEGQPQLDLARTYTGLDKRISEEFISIAMDPERKSKASSHHGSEIAAAAAASAANK